MIAGRVRTAFDHLSTSYKMFALLTLALAPLGLVALLVSLNSARQSSLRQRAELGVVAENAGRYLGSQFAIDSAVLSQAGGAIDTGADPTATCQRIDAIFSSRTARRPFALYGPDGERICASGSFGPGTPAVRAANTGNETRLDDDALTMTVPSRSGPSLAVVRYDAPVIRGLLSWAFTTPGVRGVALDRDVNSLSVGPEGDRAEPGRESFVVPLDATGLKLRLNAAIPPISIGGAVLMLLPILMWGAAAVIGFLVVDRALVDPLEKLRQWVAGREAGAPSAPPRLRTPSREIEDLADAFTRFADAQVAHEGDLSSALARQTQLTREVHHRVKNNLQVIASLISLHARASNDAAALDAYASIQRRVDALAIVHRNHYAQLDERQGLSLKPMLSELVANLRAGAPAATILVVAQPLHASLDNATTLAFLATELTELALAVDPRAEIALTIEPVDAAVGRFHIAAAALADDDELDTLLKGRYDRILNGLTRQLRTTLDRDPLAGSYSVRFPILAG